MDGNLIKTLPIIYDEEGNMLECCGYVTNNGELARVVYTYEDGACATAAWYGIDDTTIESWEVYENNEEGKIKSTKHYNGSGKLEYEDTYE